MVLANIGAVQKTNRGRYVRIEAEENSAICLKKSEHLVKYGSMEEREVDCNARVL